MRKDVNQARRGLGISVTNTSSPRYVAREFLLQTSEKIRNVFVICETKKAAEGQ